MKLLLNSYMNIPQKIKHVLKILLKLLQLNNFKPKVRASLKQLLELISKWRSDHKNKKHFDLLKIVLDESGYSSMLKIKKILKMKVE